MKSRPIIFDGESVRAILEGRKTQTRRVVKNKTALEWLAPDDLAGGAMFSPEFVANPENFLSPYGFAGDELWVREAFCQRWSDPPTPNGYRDGYWYAATDPQPVRVDGDGWTVFRKNGEEASPWKSPMFMPREASRITLRVTDVRAERVQEIMEADAIAEGATCRDLGWSFDWARVGQLSRYATASAVKGRDLAPLSERDVALGTARMAFGNRWDTINAKRGFGWAVNPWVWAVTFKVIR